MQHLKPEIYNTLLELTRRFVVLEWIVFMALMRLDKLSR